MTALTTKAVEEIEDASTRDAGRAKNLFALGVLSWLYGRPTDVTERWMEQKFGRNPAVRRPTWPPSMPAGRSARRPSCWTSSTGSSRPRTPPRDLPQRQRHDGAGAGAGRGERAQPAAAACWPATRSPRPPSCCTSSRATPSFGVRTIQAEDEIAAAGMALGAAFGGRLGVTATSGPGHRSEGRDDRPGRDARAADDRGRRSARRPLDRDADQDRAVRPADGPVRPARRVAAAGARAEHAGGCFEIGFEAAQIAVRYRTPVILLSDTFLSSSSEPWRLPAVDELPEIDPDSPSAPERARSSSPTRATSVSRGPGRSRARRGSQHRIGGLEKAD